MSTNILRYQLKNHFLFLGTILTFIRRKNLPCNCLRSYDIFSNYYSFLNIRILTESFEELMVESEFFVQFQTFNWDFDWKIKPAFFEKDELENWDMSIVIAVLPLFIKQDSESDVTVKSTSFRIGKCAPSWKLSVDTSIKKAAGTDNDLWIWMSKHVNNSITFWRFLSKWIPWQGTKSNVLDENFATKFETIDRVNGRRNQISWFGQTLVWKSSCVDTIKCTGVFVPPRLECSIGRDNCLNPLPVSKSHFYNCGIVEINEASSYGELRVWN